MNTIVDLRSCPLPHYLKEVNSLHFTNATILISGTLQFPSSDPTVGSREHVNIGNTFFAEWNIGHFCAQKGLLFPKLRVVKLLSGEYKKEIPPDESVGFSMMIIIERRSDEVMHGTAHIAFEVKKETYASSSIKFISRKQ